MPINSKNKGSTFERDVANKLTKWAGAKFMRTPCSGAIHNFNDKRVVSDIVAPLSIGAFPFSIECKNVEYDWTFDTIIKGTSTFWSHWEQATTDADREEMIPMLIFKKNYHDAHIAIYSSTLLELSKVNGKSPEDFIEVQSNNYEPIVIFPFDKFLELYDLPTVLSIH